MSTDYEYLRRRQDEIRSRRSAQWPDEEPDVDAMSWSESEDSHATRTKSDKAADEERKDRGLERTPTLN